MVKAQITLDDIRDNFDRRTITRGNDYYLDGRVINIKKYKTTSYKTEVRVTTLFSEVRGSGRHIYKQKIILPNIENTQIDGECSCPVGYNCKHVVAVLFKEMENYEFDILSLPSTPTLKSKPKQRIDIKAQKWLNKFEEVYKSSKAEPIIETRKEFLIYRLFEYRKYDNSDIEFYRAKILKNGSLSKGSILSRDSIFDSYSWKSYVDDNDKRLIPSLQRLMNVDRSSYYSKSITFIGKYGAMVLKDLVKSNKCYFKSNMQPLEFIIFHGKRVKKIVN